MPWQRQEVVGSALLLLCAALLFADVSAQDGLHQAMAMALPATTTATGVAVLDPACIPKYVDPLVLPPLMPKKVDNYYDFYWISARETEQDVLPKVASSTTCPGYTPGAKKTRVYGYGTYQGNGSTHNWPAFTIEARRNRRVSVKWVNELINFNDRKFLPHLLKESIDQTLHWANPAGLGSEGIDGSPCMMCAKMGNCAADKDCVLAATSKYEGPVPLVTHLHGAEMALDFSDGYPEAWFLPEASNLQGYSPVGSWYETFKQQSEIRLGERWFPGSATFTYLNTQKPTQLWYHDHALGITRLNVYAGLAGLYNIRDVDVFRGPELPGLPWPPPGVTKKGNKDKDDKDDNDKDNKDDKDKNKDDKDKNKDDKDKNKDDKDKNKDDNKGGDDKNKDKNQVLSPREIPIVIQDRTFDVNAQLYYPKNQLPRDVVLPAGAVPPMWIPEFAGITLDGTANGASAVAMVVNGKTWPKFDVQREPYRLRFLNGCNARALIVYLSTTLPTAGTVPVPVAQRFPMYVIGNEAGFFPSIVGPVTRLLIGPAERYDVIVDFSKLPPSTGVTQLYLLNEGPEVPFNGANIAEQLTLHTAQVMRFDVDPKKTNKNFEDDVKPKLEPALAKAYTPINYPTPARTRKFTLIEVADAGDNVVALYLGDAGLNGTQNIAIEKTWSDDVTTNAAENSVEDWEMINLTVDSHPIHIHETYSQIISQRPINVTQLASGGLTWEVLSGPINSDINPGAILTAPCNGGTCVLQKDTYLVPPGTVVTYRLKTNSKGLFPWHCHLLEHEDNEMMRPWCTGQPGYKHPRTGNLMCPGPN